MDVKHLLVIVTLTGCATTSKTGENPTEGSELAAGSPSAETSSEASPRAGSPQIGETASQGGAPLGGSGASAGPTSPTALGQDAIRRMAGCYLVDYNYHETKSLKPKYAVDPRVYDSNDKKTAMEYIVAVPESDRVVRLQHVLFILDEDGKTIPGSMIRHQAEDWEYEPGWVWEYVGGYRWKRVDTTDRKGQWVRRITNLDDGLRYQCLAPWKAVGARTEWKCGENFSPIPGRETRDMKRSDYQGMMRETRLVLFPASWVERQKNVKTVVQDAKRQPIAEEVGRNWYVRAPDAQCAEAAKWATERMPFWKLLQATWAPYFADNTDWKETPPGKGSPRWSKIVAVEKNHFPAAATDPQALDAARKEIQAIIEADRIRESASAASGAPKRPRL